MKFSEIIDQASELLQRKGRVSYRTLGFCSLYEAERNPGIPYRLNSSAE